VYVYDYFGVSTKLVRKQLLLDPTDLLLVEQIIKNQPEYTSLSLFVREILKEQIQIKPKKKHKRLELLAKKGSVKTDGDGFEAVNHNAIYKI